MSQQNKSTVSTSYSIPTSAPAVDSKDSNSKKRTLDEITIDDNASHITTVSEGSTPPISTPRKERKGRKAPHELLTDAEKKANHIASEKKRRQNIRLGFDQLIDIVPTLNQEGNNRSEALILQKSVDHIRHLINEKNDLKSQIKDLENILGESTYDDDVR
ncbi:hypothetical protein BDF20DRAFT_912029 [Mycotypha africana]|uniref:uncharacterized protein n=1 Tax=Mycotypha africana TaxID=64632 RepID=UPI002301617D|nr:uncharacterized protein BDF20DRAFT_912029 [Mycotypha africana]KAI8981781.1 hypothetical protein BDF20DRAFT_912029 [Mycotypha africana]